MNTLPDKPSEIIRLAIADMQLVEADPRYSFNMNYWHTGNQKEEICYVCMAGSVMAKTLNAPIGEELDMMSRSYNDPEKLPEGEVSNGRKLQAINSFRLGFLEDGCRWLALAPSLIKLDKIYEALPFLDSLPYDNMQARDLPQFYHDMLAIAAEFEKRDL